MVMTCSGLMLWGSYNIGLKSQDGKWKVRIAGMGTFVYGK